MKLVTAIIKPFKLDDVRAALSEIGISGMTVTEVKGFGRQRGHRSSTAAPSTSSTSCRRRASRSRCATSSSSRWTEAIINAAKTGKVGDGKIFVTSIERVIRIRTSEMDEAAI